MSEWSDYAREVQAAADSAGRRADTEMKSLKCRIQELEKACKEWSEVSQSNYQRAKAAEAKLARAKDALEKLHHAVCGETGFARCVRDDSGTAYPWPALDNADALASATLAKLKGEQP